MKTLVLSNINMQPIVPLLKSLEAVDGGYNTLLPDLMNPASQAASEDYSRVLCLFDTDALLGDAAFGEDVPDHCGTLIDALGGYCSRNPRKIVVAHTFCVSSSRWLTFADLTQAQSLRAREASLNERLVVLARGTPNLVLLDLDTIMRRHGEQELLSPTFWYAGRVRYTKKMFRILATTIEQALDAYGNRARKVLVLDLDNTLWGGIVGETGPLDIELSEEGKGRCFRDFQRALKALTRTGVILAVCSKNNAADVDEVFERNQMMVLRRQDFASLRVNWDPKPGNITDIATTLDLGLDSFVFLDDNPVERALVSQMLPEVAVPNFPTDITKLPGWFSQEVVPRYFGKYAINAEDRNKTAQYQANEVRRDLSRTLDLDTFLAELEMDCKLYIDRPEQISRAAQMTQKTNQFNLTTRRYQIPDIQRFVESADHSVILLDYKDRFGAEGIVGLAIVDLAEGRIDTFLMSCRVIGRKVENRIIDKAGELIGQAGGAKMIGEYVPTRKNGLVSHFYEGQGFTLSQEFPDGRRLYERPV